MGHWVPVRFDLGSNQHTGGKWPVIDMFRRGQQDILIKCEMGNQDEDNNILKILSRGIAMTDLPLAGLWETSG